MPITIEIADPEPVAVYVCQECDERTTDEPEYHKLYECPECGDKFTDANGGGRHGTMCPNCNKFGSRADDGPKKLGVLICPSCEQGEAVEEHATKCPYCDELLEDEDEGTYIDHVFGEHSEEIKP